MSDEMRQATKEEVLSILEAIQEEVHSDKIKGVQVALQVMIATEESPHHIRTSHIAGKQFIITLNYEE